MIHLFFLDMQRTKKDKDDLQPGLRTIDIVCVCVCTYTTYKFFTIRLYSLYTKISMSFVQWKLSKKI